MRIFVQDKTQGIISELNWNWQKKPFVYGNDITKKQQKDRR